MKVKNKGTIAYNILGVGMLQPGDTVEIKDKEVAKTICQNTPDLVLVEAKVEKESDNA